MAESSVDEVFPFDSYRGKQKQVIEAIIKAFYEDGYKNVVLDAPTGVGKSVLNTSVLRYGENGFYTTPAKSLREQIQNDEGLEPHVESLKARRDYRCGVSNENCKECPIYNSAEQSCSEQGPKCTYFGRKKTVMSSPISVITFSNLIVDNNIPTEVNGQQISFDDREILVVDEAQGLLQQVEEMHAGFKLSPFPLPEPVYRNAIKSAPYDATMYKDVKDEVNTVLSRCLNYVDGAVPMDMSPEQKTCQSVADKIKWMNEQVQNGQPWVVEVDSVKHGGGYKKYIKLTPVNVGSFLQNFVWKRANKRLISTATLPYRATPEIWLRKVGLDPDETQVINVSMPFPVKNRPIFTSTMVASMSSGGFDDNLDAVLDTMNELAMNHRNQKGLVHTGSYARAQKIKDAVDEDEHPYLHDNIFVHNQDRDTDVQIEEWQESNFDLMFSPSMTEGVDLKDDACRYQILAKVPYPSRDARTEYVINNEEWGWMEYFERTLIRVVQSYGRAVRSREDYANYYVLDEDFNTLLKKRNAPEWFAEAITDEEPITESVFDY